MKKKEVTFVRMKLTSFEFKLAKFLKKKGFIVNSVTFYELKDEQKKMFDNDFYFLHETQRNLSMFSKFIRFPKFYLSLKKIKNTIIIGITSSSNWFVTAMFILFGKRAQKKIYFPYDITYFRYKDYKKNAWHVRLCEKYNFRHCDGIIHKGPNDEFKHLPKEFNALEKPNIQFLPYCDDNLIINMDKSYLNKKLSKKDGNIHLVYVGGVYHNTPGQFPTIDIFREILEQGIFLDAYITKYDNIVDDPEYKELQKNRYFTLHQPIYSDRLQEELGKYDWGISIFYNNFEELKEIWPKTTIGNKISTYLEAGLPSIVNDEFFFMADVVEKNRFGFVINKVGDLSDKLKDINYQDFINDLNKNRDNYTIESNIDRLINFINDRLKD